LEDYSIIKDSYQIKSKNNIIEKLINIQKIKNINNRSYKKRKKQRGINCPVDTHTLITISIEDIFIEYCPKCFGIWLDFGELEKLLKKKISNKKLLSNKEVPEYVNRMHKKCPLCKKNMIIKKDYNSNVYIDICNICSGIWLDTGELTKILKEFQKDTSIKTILADVIGKYIDIEV
jgi:Zn-finger nucleic acid-binding protein